MKLIDRMSKDNRKKLREHYKPYQSTWKVILDDLDRAEYKIYVSVMVANDIYNAIYPGDVFDLVKYYELFKSN